MVEAKFGPDQVDVIGRFSDYTRASDAGGEATYHFCPECGVSVFNTTTADSDVWVPIGAFADPSFPPPTVSVFESRRASVGDHAEHHRDAF